MPARDVFPLRGISLPPNETPEIRKRKGIIDAIKNASN